MANLTLVSSSKCYGGFQKIFRHFSKELNCEMNFSIFLPPQIEDKALPVLYWLSGLTCTEKNFIEKSGFQRHAVQHGIIVVGPDTSPRNCNIEGEEDNYDFGTGAGFYIDATKPKWKDHYRMYSYVTKELPDIIIKEFRTTQNMAISGHSMGGHGALICSLKNPSKYLSVSAFAPICNPSQCPWGKNAFNGYLGTDESYWKMYDATNLVKEYDGPSMKILIDQGTDDIYLKEQLLPQNLISATEKTKIEVNLRMQEGYDHSYYFVSTFLGDHFAFHAKNLTRK